MNSIRGNAILVVSLILLMSAGIVKADTLSDNDIFGPALVTWSTNLEVIQFDPSLGSLNSVTIVISAEISGSMGFEHLGTLGPAVPDITLEYETTTTEEIPVIEEEWNQLENPIVLTPSQS